MRMRPSHRIKFDVILTNYEIVNMDCTTLNSVDWAVLVVDEAHRLKSQQSLVCCLFEKVSVFHFPRLPGSKENICIKG